jgi:hypothetical protein
VQSFFGKINFIRGFIPNFTEIIKPISNLLKNDKEFKWDDHAIIAFKTIKNAISVAPVLVSPNYLREFQVFSFDSEETIDGVLLQKNDNNQEQTIAFMNQALRDPELNYKIMKKQAYTLVQSLKHLWPYVGYLKIIAYVSDAAVNDILTQQHCLGVCGKWVCRIQEYDLKIRPTKLVKGQGLAKMLAKGNEKALNVNMVSVFLDNLEKHERYMDIIYYLRNLECPDHLVDHKRRVLRLKASKYCIVQGGLG